MGKKTSVNIWSIQVPEKLINCENKFYYFVCKSLLFLQGTGNLFYMKLSCADKLLS